MNLPRSLADIRALLADLPGPDEAALGRARAREPQLTKPQGSLGRLEEISAWLAAWQGRHPPRLDKVRMNIFAGNHGIARQGVSAFPPEVTVQMVANFQAGGAAINQLCYANNIALTVELMEEGRPTADFSQAPAMDEAEFLRAFVAGMKAVKAGTDLLCLGEMGIANTSAAAAVALGLFGGAGADWTGPGTGVAGEALSRKAEIVGAAVARRKSAMTDPIEVLRHVGGFELAAMAGACLAARFKKIPVMLDGYVCTAAVAPLFAANPKALDHCRIGHVSAEPAHIKLVEKLGQRALLDLSMRLGEGSGAAVAVGVARSALACHNGMATFAEAGVSDKE